MDLKLQVTRLRQQSEQLQQLSTALSADLRRLEVALSQPESTPDPTAVRLFVGVGAASSRLYSVTELLCQRLQRLLNQAHISHGLPLRPERDEAWGQ